MSPSPEKSTFRRRAAILVGLVTFFSFLYFYEGGGWNQNSRFDLLRAIIERHTLQIDAYHENTQDKAHFRGHYYSDKAPGLVFLAVPFALAARPVLRSAGVDPQSPRGELALSYIVGAATAALPAALGGMCLFYLGLRLTGNPSAAAFGTVILCLATPLWAYASLFWAHALVGACLISSFACALEARDSQSARGDFLWALSLGLAAGWATVTEYPAAPASSMLALFALWQVWGRGVAARWRVVAGVGLGAAICVIVLLCYLHSAFGTFRPSYSYYDPNSFTFMQRQGYMGLTYPHPDRLLKILFGCSRGLFFASPVLVFAVWGLWRLGKENVHRAAAFLAAAIVSYYFLFNASFYWWKAGLSFGPRYAGASFPLLCVGLAMAWARATRAWRRVLIATGLWGMFIALMVVSTTSQLPMQDSCPIAHMVWPAFWSGQVALNRESMLLASEGKYGAFNLGQLMGLHGLVSLIPLLAMWGIAALVWWKMMRVERGLEPSS